MINFPSLNRLQRPIDELTSTKKEKTKRTTANFMLIRKAARVAELFFFPCDVLNSFFAYLNECAFKLLNITPSTRHFKHKFKNVWLFLLRRFGDYNTSTEPDLQEFQFHGAWKGRTLSCRVLVCRVKINLVWNSIGEHVQLRRENADHAKTSKNVLVNRKGLIVTYEFLTTAAACDKFIIVTDANRLTMF